jgi:chitinase
MRCIPSGVTFLILTSQCIQARNFVAYFINWGIYGRNYQVTDIPFTMVTHINYAFGNIGPGGQLILGDPYADIDKAFPGDSWDTSVQPYRGNFWQLKKAKQQYPQLKVLLSVGGWTWSGKFSDVASSPSSRQAFAASCKTFLDTYGFDGCVVICSLNV